MSRTTRVRRTAIAASAVAFALLVTACGSDEPAGEDTPASKDKASAEAAADPAAKALTQAELDKAVLAEGDVKGLKVASFKEAELAAAKTATADDEACKPFASVMFVGSLGEPGASAQRRATAMPPEPAKDASPEEKLEAGLAAMGGAALTSDVLSSYDGQGAQEALATLRTAGEACAGGFTATVGTDKTKVTKVAPATYSGGDEAVAFTLTTDAEGESMTSQIVVARKGSTLASFFTMSLSGKTEQPKEAIDAQLAKLG